MQLLTFFLGGFDFGIRMAVAKTALAVEATAACRNWWMLLVAEGGAWAGTAAARGYAQEALR